MHFLVNLLFGISAGLLAGYILSRCSVRDPFNVVLSVIVGVVVFLANFAAFVL